MGLEVWEFDTNVLMADSLVLSTLTYYISLDLFLPSTKEHSMTKIDISSGHGVEATLT